MRRQPCFKGRVEGLGNNFTPYLSLMKNAILLLAACAFTTASFAQTPATTEVHTRDNGTKKIVTERGDTKTVTKTGKTNVGKALENTGDAAGNLAHKAGKSLKRGGKKLKHKSQTAGKKLDKKTATMEEKSAQ